MSGHTGHPAIRPYNVGEAAPEMKSCYYYDPRQAPQIEAATAMDGIGDSKALSD